MKYVIKFKFLDGKSFDMDVGIDQMDSFMEYLGKGEVYFDDELGSGVWISLDKVRYFQIEKLDAEGNKIIRTRAIEDKPNDPPWNEIM